MKLRFIKATVVALSLLVSATLSLAAEKAASKPAPAAKPAAEATAAAKKAPVDLNTATEADLKGIAGIGDTYAAKIIAGRPYAKKDQLKSRNIIPAAVYEKVKDQIVAKQGPKDAKDAKDAKTADKKPADKKAAKK